jgi:hypothetical protein
LRDLGGPGAFRARNDLLDQVLIEADGSLGKKADHVFFSIDRHATEQDRGAYKKNLVVAAAERDLEPALVLLFLWRPVAILLLSGIVKVARFGLRNRVPQLQQAQLLRAQTPSQALLDVHDVGVEVGHAGFVVPQFVRGWRPPEFRR